MFLSDLQVCERYNIKRATVWGWAKKDSTFPKPIKLSNGTTRWKLADLEAWENAQATAQSE